MKQTKFINVLKKISLKRKIRLRLTQIDKWLIRFNLVSPQLDQHLTVKVLSVQYDFEKKAFAEWVDISNSSARQLYKSMYAFYLAFTIWFKYSYLAKVQTAGCSLVPAGSRQEHAGVSADYGKLNCLWLFKHPNSVFTISPGHWPFVRSF